MPYTRAQLLEALRTDHPEFRSVDDNKLFAALAVDHPDVAKGISDLQGGDTSGKPSTVPWYAGYFSQGNDSSRTAGQVASDQAAHVLGSLPDAITSIPNTVWETLKGKGPQMIGDMLKGGGSMISTPVKQGIELAKPGLVNAPTPDAPETAAAASGAGALLGSAALPNALEGAGLIVKGAAPYVGDAARSTLQTVTTPDNLMLRAANNRVLAKAPEIPAGTPQAIIRAANNLTRVPRGAFQEKLAQWMASKDVAPVMREAPPAQSGEPIPYSPPPRSTAVFPGEIKRPATPSQEIPFSNAPRSTALFPGEVKPPAGPSQEIPFSMPPEPHPLAYEMKAQPRPAAEIPFNAPAEFQTPAKPNLKAIEEAIAPSGLKAKLSTMRNVPRLVEEAPEIIGSPKGAAFDAKLMDAFRRAERTVATAEDAIPDSMTIPKQPIVDNFSSLAKDYTERGLGNSAAVMERLAEQWGKLPADIPWDTFRNMKRAFFKESSINSAPLRRAYSQLMDSASKASGELATANRSYSVIRRGLENASIDLQTGRRIKAVGVAAKFGFGKTP